MVLRDNKDIESKVCPQCGEIITNVGNYWVCPKHGEITLEEPFIPMRIFLSYGHDANEELVLRIYSDLKDRGHDVWIDKAEIKFGDEWREVITKGILESNSMLSFLSKHSVRDPGVCLDEIAIAIGVKGGNIQTILVESEEDVKPPASICHIHRLDMHDWKERKEDGDESWYDEKFSEIVCVVESAESRRFAGEIEELAAILKPVKSDSRLAELLKKPLIGREWMFDEIEKWRVKKNNDSRLYCIMGSPGVGKSAFAAHLAHYGRDKVIAVHFCEYDKPDHRDARQVLRNIVFQLATRLSDYRKFLLTLPEIDKLDSKTPSELFDYLLANLLSFTINGNRERYLIVIDALDEASENGQNPLLELLAKDAVRLPPWLGIVITSRPEFNVTGPLQGLNPILLDTETEENRNDIRRYLHNELESLLKDRSPEEVNKLIEQILEKSEGVFLYVERFCHDVHQGHLSLDQPDEIPQGLGGIFFQYFQRQFSDIDKFRKEIRPALRAILASRRPISLEVLQLLFNWEEEELQEFIISLGLIFTVTKESSNESIKPYHKSLVDWLTNKSQAGIYFVSMLEGRKQLAEYFERDRLSDISVYELPFHLQRLERWEQLKDYIGDIEVFLKLKTAKTKYELMGYWHAIGDRYDMADTYKKTLDDYERANDSEKHLGFALNAVASFLNDSGKYSESEPLLRRTLEIKEKVLGLDHPDTATCLNNLAVLLNAKGDYDAAEPLYRRALDITERVLGPDHPDTATSLNNLALFLTDKGDYEYAEPLFRRALDICERVLGEDHLDTATSLSNLAFLLNEKGDIEAAESLCRRALNIRERVFGEDHPYTAHSLNNLASLLNDKGDYGAAEPLYRRALDIKERILGEDHPNTATCLNNLAALLKSKGDYVAAEPLYRRTLEIRERVLGKDHLEVVDLRKIYNMILQKKLN